jgi:predicted nucleotidyltransferase
MTSLYIPASLNIPNMGFMIPNMGMKKQLRTKAPARPTVGIADALFTKVQQRVLGILFGNPGRSFYANEVIALAGSGTGAVQRELTRLEAAGLLTVTRVGNQKYYRANTATPVFEELRGLVLKTSGLSDVLRAALAPLAAQISAAFVFGSVAKGQDSAESDIDLMVVSDSLSHADLFAALEESASRLGRPVNPTVYSQQQLAKRVREDNAFIKRVLAQPKLWLMGDQHGLAT